MPWSPKRVGETEIFTVDYVNRLAPGETITLAVWSNSVEQGGDPSPNAMILGTATVSGSKVSQKITGGVAGAAYDPICTAQTSLDQTLILPEEGDTRLVVCN